MPNQQLDPKVLGQLLLMQSLVNNLPDKASIFSFVCKGLLDVPGIKQVEFFENGFKDAVNEAHKTIYTIQLGSSFFGDLVVSVSNTGLYQPYEDYLRNFVFMIGIILEERKQRKINEQHQQVLEQKIFERTQELVLEKENLIESQRRFSDLMKNVRLLSIMLDENGNVFFCNDYLLNLTGYTSDEIIGQNWFDLFLEPNTAMQEKLAFQGILEGKEFKYNYENIIVTKSNEKLCISWNNTILRDSHRKIIGTASIGENITERKLAEEALIKKNSEYKYLNEEYLSLNEELTESLENMQHINNQLEIAKARAEESDRLKTAFLQNMSHEIRTPMNAIMGFSDLLVKQYNNLPKLEKYSEIINLRCHDLLDIINDILDISKIESGQLSLNNEPCNLNVLFAELTVFYKEYQKRIDKQHIKFNLSVQPELQSQTIVIDKIKLKQILINLLTNAFKFTKEGKIEGGCTLDNNNLYFFVTDTGIGIPEDMQESVFERFVQLNQKSIRTTGGTGLGLSIVKGLVHLLGGEISLTSEPEKGSTFSFSIPFQAGQKNPESIISESDKGYNFENKNILVVEDDLYNADYIKEILSNTGIKSYYATTGNDAINIALNNSIDLILMDIRLPDMDGYEATRQIKQIKPSLKVIAQTAYASHDERIKALNSGCVDYISKPTTQGQLLALINKYISNIPS